MYRVLVVDDEPYIVKSIGNFLRSLEHLDLDVYCAHSSVEAKDWLMRNRFDIILSDIQMPGVNGFELLDIVKIYWPRCKVIFLTGYSQFEYAQSALRKGASGFVLKTEGNGAIVEALETAIQAIEEEVRTIDFIQRAKQQLNIALPVLRRELLTNLVLQGSTLQERAKGFQETGIPLNPKQPVLMIVGHVDEWKPEYGVTDKALLMYAIQNIAEEYIRPKLQIVTVCMDSNRFFWLMQQGEISNAEHKENPVVFVHGMLDTIQKTCRSLLKHTISLASSSGKVAWEHLPSAFSTLSKLLIRGLGRGREMILTDSMQDAFGNADELQAQWYYEVQRRLDVIKEAMEAGNREGVRKNFQALRKHLSHFTRLMYTEVYYTIYSAIASQVQRLDLAHHQVEGTALGEMLHAHEHPSWDDGLHYLLSAIEYILEHQKHEDERKSNELVEQLHDYIHRNIAGDLSLVRLSEVVYLNPQYLCRLYKQITGMGLSEYITNVRLEKSKQLLKMPHVKVQDVAKKVGIESASYFSRFFKKYMNMTPQEYIEMCGSSQGSEVSNKNYA